ncbi:MAG: GNAT family N-acetyltransferase [Limnohabitans sp.]|nr:GNAT family N-acetyltransferase [Limnohabitans sp.]
MQTNNIEIRKAESIDAEELSNLICENAEKILKPHYNEKQLEIFIRYYSKDVMLDKIQNQIVFCAEINNQIVGTIALEKNFVVGFYTKLEYLNQGVGKKLMKHLENFAKNNGMRNLKLAASPEGLSFYYKNDWLKIKDFVIEYYGVGFEETLMEKKL